MTNISRQILHSTSNQVDKVYIVEINLINQRYVVSTTWGKRTAKNLNTQIRHSYQKKQHAVQAAMRIAKDKMLGKDRYKNIEPTTKVAALGNIVIPASQTAGIQQQTMAQPVVNMTALVENLKPIRKIRL